jgi:hypothetical protein
MNGAIIHSTCLSTRIRIWTATGLTLNCLIPRLFCLSIELVVWEENRESTLVTLLANGSSIKAINNAAETPLHIIISEVELAVSPESDFIIWRSNLTEQRSTLHSLLRFLDLIQTISIQFVNGFGVFGAFAKILSRFLLRESWDYGDLMREEEGMIASVCKVSYFLVLVPMRM